MTSSRHLKQEKLFMSKESASEGRIQEQWASMLVRMRGAEGTLPMTGLQIQGSGMVNSPSPP